MLILNQNVVMLALGKTTIIHLQQETISKVVSLILTVVITISLQFFKIITLIKTSLIVLKIIQETIQIFIAT